MIIENVTFRLNADADVAAFLEADRRVQHEFVPKRSGFARRTTARGTDGEWIVVTLWASQRDASASADLSPGDPAVDAFMSFVDTSTLRVSRYATLD